MSTDSDAHLADYEQLITQLNADQSLHFVLRASELGSPALDQATIDTILAKLFLYPRNAIVVGSTVSESVTIGGVYTESSRKIGDAGNYELAANRARSAGLPRIHFLPKAIETSYEDYENSDSAPAQWTETRFSFDALYRNPNGLPLGLNDTAIAKHVLEPLNADRSQACVLPVWLPELRNIPLEDLVKLRDDHYDAFERFQSAVAKLATTSGSQVSSVARVKEVFQEVHNEVKQFDARMRALQSQRSIRRWNAFVGSAMMGLCYAIPSGVAQTVLSVLGAYQAKDFVKDLFADHKEARTLKLNDFYVPWLCTRLDRK